MDDITTYSPASEEEASQILQKCSQTDQKVRITGGGTKDWLGNPYAPTPVVISTSKLDQLVDYQPEDLTITVGAGMTFARLQEILAANDQFLPLDPPNLPGQTLGGVLATNRSGPRRLLYGTARDLLIGCRFVLADGSIGHSGGRVVKNVAGYDLHKLFIGAMGTLGLLTEVTFKVVPKPQAVGVTMAHFQEIEAATAAARRCVRSNLMPSALELVGTAEGSFRLLVGADGTGIAVENQLIGLAELCTAAGATEVQTQAVSDGERVWQEFTSMGLDFKELVLKASTTLTDLPRIIKTLGDLKTKLGSAGLLQAQAGTGIAYLYSAAPQMDYGQTASLIEGLRKDLARIGGSLVVERGPAALKALIDVWGSPNDAGPMMRSLRDKLDPQRLLNPGVLDLVG